MWQNKITSTSWWSSFFYSLVRLIIPPVFSTASRLTNSYHFSGNVAWQFFYDFSSASRLRTFYDFSGASRLKITCTFSGAPPEKFTHFHALCAWQGAPRLRPPWPGLDPLFAPWSTPHASARSNIFKVTKRPILMDFETTKTQFLDENIRT